MITDVIIPFEGYEGGALGGKRRMFGSVMYPSKGDINMSKVTPAKRKQIINIKIITIITIIKATYGKTSNMDLQ